MLRSYHFVYLNLKNWIIIFCTKAAILLSTEQSAPTYRYQNAVCPLYCSYVITATNSQVPPWNLVLVTILKVTLHSVSTHLFSYALPFFCSLFLDRTSQPTYISSQALSFSDCSHQDSPISLECISSPEFMYNQDFMMPTHFLTGTPVSTLSISGQDMLSSTLFLPGSLNSLESVSNQRSPEYTGSLPCTLHFFRYNF